MKKKSPPTQKQTQKAAPPAQKIIVLDFGSQYTQLIARRLRELRFYTEIHPYHIGIEAINAQKPAGIILSGGPSSVYDKDAPMVDKKVFEMGIPILGICYGLQLICHLMGGKVAPSTEREYGRASLRAKSKSPLLQGIKLGRRKEGTPARANSVTSVSPEQVWMSHGDRIHKLPKNFSVIGVTENSPMAAFADEKNKIYGVQFHPEVHHSTSGKTILKN
ncbi:MAG TPA: glutamine-hydrolyzing GMP synthase, partial [Turneriella sp.]|nr:glutamine-hydrolyzing GMP synthase [Turneriella sp.]